MDRRHWIRVLTIVADTTVTGGVRVWKGNEVRVLTMEEEAETTVAGGVRWVAARETITGRGNHLHRAVVVVVRVKASLRFGHTCLTSLRTHNSIQ